jgi:hypothetical protein
VVARRSRPITVALLAAAVLVAVGLGAYALLKPSTAAKPRLVWSSEFSRGNFTGWSWWGQTQQNIWGHIAVVRPQSVGVPRRFGPYIGRFQTTRADLAHGRYNAKLYKYFDVDTAQGPRTPSNVSGTYSAWYYLPRNFAMQPKKWINMFQFKELFNRTTGSSLSLPLWWVQLGTASWAKAYPGASWATGKPARGDAPVIFLNHWDNHWTRHVGFAAAPLGRWFEISADVHQGDRIDFYLNGHKFDTARASDYPVSPFRARSEAWIFGVGDYGTDAAGPMYIARASYSAPSSG